MQTNILANFIMKHITNLISKNIIRWRSLACYKFMKPPPWLCTFTSKLLGRSFRIGGDNTTNSAGFCSKQKW